MFLAVTVLILLRVAIGFHFFKEGTDKLRTGDFTAEYFLRGAKGPAAPWFQKLIRDLDGKERLCITETSSSGNPQYEFDTELTFAIWNDFIDEAYHYYGFGNQNLETQIVDKRAKLADQIKQARLVKDASVNTAKLESQRREAEQDILKIRTQLEDAERILETHQQQLSVFLEANRTDIMSHYQTADRLQGFERDGANRAQVATYVDSLRDQVDTIRSDRDNQLAGWVGEVE